MRNGFFPIFAKGRVLKRESIEYLRDFPYDLASLVYENYSDGILCGFSISSEDGWTHITKGALKYLGNIIVVPENTVAMAESSYGKFLYAKLIMGKSYETEDSKICPMELKVDTREAVGRYEIELGRFCLNSGAILRCEYDSFSDLRTPENTLDLTRVSYAGYDAPTLHPRVLKEYALAVLAYAHDAADVAFAVMCLNASIIHKSSIQWHIAKKINSSYVDYTLPKLYDKLEELLPQIGLKKRERQRGKGPAIT